MASLPAGGSDLSRVPLRRMPAQARSRDKVARALDAADRIARRDGVAALSLPRVAEEAGVSVGALHQYLPDRDAITAALVAGYHERIEQLLDELIERTEQRSIEDPVGEVIAQIARIYEEESAVRLVRAAGAGVAVEASRDHKRRMVVRVGRLLRAAGAPDASPAKAQVAFLAADAVMHEAFAADGAPDRAMLGELELLLRGYLIA